MFAFLRKLATPKQSTTQRSNSRRTLLRVEQVEERDVPSALVYSNTFNWNGVASVTETVTLDAPGHMGQYLWNFNVTNVSFGSGMSKFAVPVEDTALVSNCGSSTFGWTGSIGAFVNDPSLVAWQSNGPPLSFGGSADFWFTTAPTGLALSSGFLTNPGLTGGFVAAPVPMPAPPAPLPPGAPLPAVLVTTALDEDDANNGKTSLREAIKSVNDANLPNQQFQVRFAVGMALQGAPIRLNTLGSLTAVDPNLSIFINGTGRNITVERDANSQFDFRLIHGRPDSKIEIAGLTFKNGKALPTTNGGAIFGEGDVTLWGCTIQDSKAEQGGGVYSVGKLIATDCNFTKNTADDGGGLFAASDLTLQNCQIVENTASVKGGGVYAASGGVSVQDTLISANKAQPNFGGAGGGEGGGIYVGDQVSYATLANDTIRDNRATSSGGGVYVEGGAAAVVTTVELLWCDVFNNKALNGGGVAIRKDHLTVQYTNIYSNYADTGAGGFGGGVYLGDNVKSATFSHSLVGGNTAKTSGGGIWIEVPQAGVNLAVTLNDTWVLGNTAASTGGGIGVSALSLLQGGGVALYLGGNTVIGGNTLTAEDSKGGGLFLGYGTVIFDGVTFTTNSAGSATGFFVAHGADVDEWLGGVSITNDTWFIEP